MKNTFTILAAIIFYSFTASATTYTFSRGMTNGYWTCPSCWSPSYPGTTISLGDTILVSGTNSIVFDSTSIINMNGTMIFDTQPWAQSLIYGGKLIIGNTGKIFNNGRFIICFGGELEILGNVSFAGGILGAESSIFMYNDAKILIQATGNLFIEDSLNVGYMNDPGFNIVITNGILINDGRIDNYGVLNGTGSITTSTSSSNGIIIGPGSVAPGLSPGELKTDFDFTLSQSGSLDIEIGGTTAGSDYDVLGGTGDKKLGGILNVLLYNNYVPTAGESYTIIKGGAISETFDAINFPALPNNMTWEISYNPTDVTLKVNAATAVNNITAYSNLKIYPNPTNGQILFAGLNNETYLYTIYTIAGQKIQTGTFDKKELELTAKTSQLLFIEIVDAQNNKILKPINLIR